MSAARVFWFVVVLLLLPACGGGSGGDAAESEPAESAVSEPAPTTAASPSAAAASSGPVDVGAAVEVKGSEDLSGNATAKLTLTLDDSDGLFFDPTFVKVDPGATVNITLDNVGFVDHNFAIDSMDIDKDVASEKKAKVKVTMPEADALRFYCNIHPSMAGAFYSEEGQEVQS